MYRILSASKYFLPLVYFIYLPCQIDETGNFKTINENNQHAEEIAELKAKFLRHKDILKTNYEQAENEVIRLDEIYHDTVGMVLKVKFALNILGYKLSLLSGI